MAEGTAVTTTTNATGGFRFALLKPGEYRLTISQKGFKSIALSVQVTLGQVTTANLKLELGSESEVVEVTGAAPLIQTENANLSTTMSAKLVDLIPNSGNDLTAVAYTAPGVLQSTQSGSGGYGNFIAYGLPGTANLFTVNGNDEMDPYMNLNNSGATNLLLGKNEIDETAIVSNGYTGQYGRQAGAQVDYATKSGSNSFHGNAMYWWNGRAMNANDWFNNQARAPRPFVNNNQYAARLGGPIKKDKAFFFVDYEGLRLINATSSEVIIPSASFLQAVAANVASGATTYTVLDPAQLPDNKVPIQPFANDPAVVPFYQNFLNLNAGAPGIGRAVPLSAAVDPAMGCGDLTPQTTGPLAGYGTTLPCAVNLRTIVGQPSKEWILTARTDFNLTNNDKVFIRYRMDRGLQPTTTDAISPLFNAVSDQPQYEGQVNYTRTITPTTINQFIASGSWYSAIFDLTNRAKAIQTFPYALIENTGAGWYSGGASGLFGPSSAFPQGRVVTQYQFTDDLSMTRGIHEFKTGINFRRNDITDWWFGRRAAEPQVYIDGGNTGFNGMDLFVNGLTGRVRQYFPKALEQPMAIYSFGAYFQDVMRLKTNLKLTLTLRADRNSNAVCQTGCVARLSGAFSQLNHDPGIPFNEMFHTNKALFPNIEKIAFQPRFGFTWNPWGKSNTVIRGGIGLFTDLYPATLIDSYANQSPTSNRFTFRPPNPMPISPADTSNPLGPPVEAQIATCNTLFNSTFTSGGTLADYNSAARALFGTTCAKPDFNSILPSTVANPKYVEWNLEVQRSFGTKSVLSVNYVGNRGYDLFVFNPWVNAYQGSWPGAMGLPWNGLPTAAPDTRINNVSELTNNGTSNYNGVTASFTRRLTKGFTGSINYTYSHALDDISNGGMLQFSLDDSYLYQFNPAGLRVQNYSNADYDVRHSMSANYVWELPFKTANGVLNQVIGGWTISGAFFARTGYPFTVTDGYPGLLLGNALGVTGIPAQWNGTGPTSCGRPTVDSSNNLVPCLDATAQFPISYNGTETGFSTTRRNIFRGPNYFNTDLDLLKRFKVTEKATFAVGANFYNILNHPNFANPNTDVNGIYSAPFGTVNSTSVPATSIYGAFVGSAVSGRVVQLHARVEF
jgi:Carboxypeptidase regulatory-like domain